MSKHASYTYLSDKEWDDKIDALDHIASSCELCPRRCGVNRLVGETGFCGAPGQMVISSIFPHHGEEPPISGTGGSGTVFFTYCTLKCIFCQNYQISHMAEGKPYAPSELAEKMLSLQTMGCHNINLVTATHFLPWVARALKEAASRGLTIPVVYNCGGYELASVMALLSGVVDIYLPDMKYGDNAAAQQYSKAPDYVAVNREAIREMFRQVGPLRMDDNGIAFRGLCIRHLMLPDGEAGSADILNYLKSKFDPHDLYVSLMAQYRPLHRAATFPRINRPVTAQEYEPLRQEFIDAGFDGFYQEISKIDTGFVIDFTKRKSERLTGDN
jgi:putative pyruvate formate lyase activating enzyme